MNIKDGFFFITDITGYTQFLTRSELDHAKEILDALFDVILVQLNPPLVISSTQGDAIICYVPEEQLIEKQTVIESMENVYFSFRRQLNLMKLNTTCECKACVNMTFLDLKVFLHYGQYMLQDIGANTDLQGADIILIHKLMKNAVKEKFGLPGYGLLTASAVAAIGLQDLTDGMQAHMEDVEDFGEIPVYIYDLRAAWEQESGRERQIVQPEETIAYAEVLVPIPQWAAWDISLNLEFKRRFLELESHDRLDKADTRLGAGASFHCKHHISDVDYFVLDMQAPQYMTSQNHNLAFNVNYPTTLSFTPIEGGTLFAVRFGVADAGDLPEIKEGLQPYAETIAKIFGEIVAEEIEAGRIVSGTREGGIETKEEMQRPVAKRFSELD